VICFKNGFIRRVELHAAVRQLNSDDDQVIILPDA